MRMALDDLKLDALLVAYPGTRQYSLGDRVRVAPLVDLTAPRGRASVLKHVGLSDW